MPIIVSVDVYQESLFPETTGRNNKLLGLVPFTKLLGRTAKRTLMFASSGIVNRGHTLWYSAFVFHLTDQS